LLDQTAAEIGIDQALLGAACGFEQRGVANGLAPGKADKFLGFEDTHGIAASPSRCGGLSHCGG
jgi:hypothetical protein